MKIPKGYDLKIYSITVENENQYLYSDSSMIYLTNFKNTPNYKNILYTNDSIFNFRFQNQELIKGINELSDKESIKILPDTFELSGIDKDSLYWKDIKFDKISIGYKKISKEKKDMFDGALKSFKKGN